MAAEAKEKKKKTAEEPAAKVPAEPASPRPLADPRFRAVKKFQGRFLPKGVLRERQKTILKRWDSGDDHGGVTLEELKALLADWKGSQEKPPRKPQG